MWLLVARIVAYTGVIYALYDADDTHHKAVRDIVQSEPGTILIPTVVLAELDYLLREFLGVAAELDFFDGLDRGAYTLEPFTSDDLHRCRELIATYKDLDPGLVDVAVIATAERLGIQRILTMDERDFRAI